MKQSLHVNLCLPLILGLAACKTGGDQDAPRGTNLLKPAERKEAPVAPVAPVVPAPRSTAAPVEEVSLEGSGVNNGIGGAISNLVNCKSEEGRFTLRTTAILTAYQGVLELGKDSWVFYCRPESEAEKPRELFVWTCRDFKEDGENGLPQVNIRKDLHSKALYAEIKLEEGEKTMECSEPAKKSKAGQE